METPLKKRLVDKDWKGRVSAYEELAGIAQRREITEAAKYVPFLKKMVSDSYPRAQDQALSTLLAFAELQLQMDPIQVGEVASVVIEKCLAGRSTTKDKATKILIALMEAGYSDTVLAQLLKGCANKVPKVVAASLFTIREALKAFGTSQIPIDKIMPVVKVSFDHSLQEVRTEALALTTEVHRWLGDGVSSVIDEWDLRPAQRKELELMFKNNIAKSNKGTLTPDRRIRANSLPPTPLQMTPNAPASPIPIRKSQDRIPTETPPRRSTERSSTERPHTPKTVVNLSSSPPIMSPTSFDVTTDGDINNFEIKDLSDDDDDVPLDSPQATLRTEMQSELNSNDYYTHFVRDETNGAPLNILGALTKGWYQEVSTGKWQDRKMRIDAVISMCESPPTTPLQLQSGDYAKLVKELCEMLDYNKTVVVVSAVKLIGYLAKGLGREFLIHGRRLVPVLLDQLKGKNTMVLSAIRECLDDIHASSFTLSEFISEIADALNHKVPQVRRETLHWIKTSVRSNANTISDIKPFSKLLVKCLDDSQAPVRETAYSILAILIAQRGDVYMHTLVEEFELDRIKVGKLKESVHSSSDSMDSLPPLSSSPPSAGGSGRPRSNSGSRRSSTPADGATSHVALTHSQPEQSHTSGHSNMTHSSPALYTPHSTPSKTPLKDLFNQATNQAPSSPTPAVPLSQPFTPIARTIRTVSNSPSSPKVKETIKTEVLQDTPKRPAVDSDVGDSVGWFREVMTMGLAKLDGLEQSLQAAHNKNAEDEHFTSELHAWNEQLLEEIEGYKTEVAALKKTVAELEDKVGKPSLPSVLELQNLTEEELDELEQKQEEYLLQIRKIKIRMLH